MKAISKSIFFVFIVLMIVGCGQDGEDGKVFLRFRSVLTPISFFIDNPDIPADFQYDTYYEIQPGSYAFTYVDHNNVTHPLPGEISFVDITASIGQEGSLFKGGGNGQDLYVDLILLSTGAIIENYDYYTIASTLDYNE